MMLALLYLICTFTLVYGFRPHYRKRIKKYYEERGMELLALESTPFAVANSNLFTAQYMDTQGNIHKVMISTTLFGDLFFADDKIIIYNQTYLREQENKPR